MKKENEVEYGNAKEMLENRRRWKILSNLEDIQTVPVYTAHGRSVGRSGKGKVRIVGFGPEVETRIFTFCGGNTERLVGTCFFRQLKGYRLIWDFDRDEICIEEKRD